MKGGTEVLLGRRSLRGGEIILSNKRRHFRLFREKAVLYKNITSVSRN